ncbi:hypothetical protein PVL29_018321 [Vitis rotundifolia]|uniref:Uncharacterized protein n=1 Tax=Vitis rotundifolia TaxID=103349 RepID=A0AA38Z4R6_VITRO|nr:hypothetical protein PVL29_018321 [Vitis rotundifolia]
MIGRAVAAWSWRSSTSSSSSSFGTLLHSLPRFNCSSVFVSSDLLSKTLPPLDHIDGVISRANPMLCMRSQPSIAKFNGFFLGLVSKSKHHSIVISMCKLEISFGIPPDLYFQHIRLLFLPFESVEFLTPHFRRFP